MSDELETAKQIATHPATTGAGIMAVVSWLANKVWRGHRHEITNMKQVSSGNTALIKELDGKLDGHIEKDHEWHSVLQQQMSDNHSEIKSILIEMAQRK